MTTTAAVASRDELDSDRERYPIRSVDVVAVVLFWGLLAMVSTASRELDPRFPGVPELVVTAVVRATHLEYATWALLTIPIWWATSRYAIESGRRIGRIIVFVAAGFALAWLVDALMLQVRMSMLEDITRFRRRPPPSFLFGLGYLDDLMVYFAVLGSGIARDYFLRYRARLAETGRLQALLTQARLDALRSQLNPHFLFNTLNAVSALVERDARSARRMIARLSDILRYTLEESTEDEVTLARELDLVTEYVELMQIRFQGKLDVGFRIGEGTPQAYVPNLILQPIVENAIKHGVTRNTGPGRIDISTRRDGDMLVITVRDSGPGPGSGSSAEGTGVGLANTQARLRQMYGGRAGITLLQAANGQGAVAEMIMPFHTTPRREGEALADA